MNALTLQNKLLVLVLPLVLLLSACASTPESNPALAEARNAVTQAQSQPGMKRLAASEMNKAEEQLARAERAFDNNAETSEVNHLAYLAERQAEVAVATLRLREMEARVDELSRERERVQLEARAQRAERRAARSEAEADRAEAERLRAQAAAAAEAAERAQAEERAQSALERRRMAEEELAMAQQQRVEAERLAAELIAQNERMAQEAQRLQEQVQELEAKPTDRGLVLTLGSDVLFDFDKAELKDGATRTVTRVGEFLDEYEERQVLVEGFTDSVGARDYNMELSERRANAVRSALVEQGVDPARIKVRGYGPQYPVASNDTDAGRQLNRRVEVIISEDAEAVPERE